MDKHTNNKDFDRSYKVQMFNKSGFVYLLLAVACFLISFVIQGGLNSTFSSIATDIHDKVDSMSVASGGSESM